MKNESNFTAAEIQEPEVSKKEEEKETAISEKAREGMLYNLLKGPSTMKRGKYYFVP